MPRSVSPALRSSFYLTQKRRLEEKDPKSSYFKEVLSEAGVFLKDNDNPNYITQEQALAVRDISKTLKSHMSFPTNAQEFIKDLKNVCNQDECFRKLLLPTELRKGDEVSHPAIQQDSIIRILLNVPCLQDEIIELLLKHVTESAVDDNNDTTWLRLLLNPLRYLSHINNSKMLTTKLVDITEIATFAPQLEILNLIPEIIPDIEYEETAKQLSKLLDDNPDLTGAIIDCLNALNLNAETRREIRQQILGQIHTNRLSKIFPILFEFVTAECSGKNLQEVLLSIRNALDGIFSSVGKNKDVDSNKALICNRLQALITARKSLYEGWVTLISNVRTDIKPIDLFVLFMLHSTGKMRKSSIEALFKKRVKLGLFKITHLEALFKNYFVVQTLKDYFNSIVEIAISFLRFHNDSTLVEYSEVIFKLLFNHNLIVRLQRQDIIYSLTFYIGMSDKKAVRSALKILVVLSEDLKKLQEHTVQLMGLLEKLDTINLSDVKLIFGLLCSLTCGERSDETMSGLKDEIHMIIRKQLSSSKKSVKHRGIIAAITMIKALVFTSNDEMVVDDMDESLLMDDLPTGGPREAASLLELTNTCTLGSPDSVGLFYDELAYLIITTPQIKPVFMVWLYQLFTNDFQNNFVVEAVPQPINDIEFSMQFALNTSEEVDTQIAVNIGELTLKSQFYEHSSVLILAPLFRLLRLIHYKQHEGDLATIDALLGCAVIMPQLEDIEIYDSEQLRQVADCIFHCINWFRELINAFVTQKNRQLRGKVLERLSDVVRLQEILEKCLEDVPDYKPPLSYFDTQSQATKQLSPSKVKVSRPKKKQKTADTTNINETVASTSAVTQPTQTKVVNKKKREVTLKREFNYREMDTDIILLLRYRLQVDADLNTSFASDNGVSQMTNLTLSQFTFLIHDLIHKLSALTNRKDLGLSHITIIKLEDLIQDCLKLFPSIKNHLKKITNSIGELIKSANGTEQMYTPSANNLKKAFASILECYALIFRWSGFQHPKNLNLLKDFLRNSKTEQAQIISLKALITEFYNILLDNIEHCLTLSAAVSLIEVMQALYAVNSHFDLKERIASASKTLLSKRWYNEKGNIEMGKDAYLCIDKLLKAYLSNATTTTICGLVGTLQEEVTNLKIREDSLDVLKTIDKCNFHVFYRCLCTSLVEVIRDEITSLTNEQHLVLWRETALSMQGLMLVVKVQETKINLINYLKNCIAILKIFLSSGIPILEIMLPSKTTEVVEIFKLIQTSTRFLHQLCCYSKFVKDVSLVTYVPQFRQILESLIYQVKAALVANNCSDAFWMGTLKNKDYHGEEILTQSTVQTLESNENEELPPDDTDDEMETDLIGSDNESTASDII